MALSNAEQCRRYRQRLRERAYELFGAVCQDCGALLDLEFAHLIPTTLCNAGRGMTNRYLDVLKNKECYRLLCVDCHEEVDGRIKELW